ncbi:Hypothetical protein CINCED_3A011058 [Cinara cedri]|uniref:Regucalcin n=1 Tax=Cinara cedri TaxID=506608 RepID=A0A5E4MGY9_9HEMI|nr:Hypothetical protein CINCED_3A011058 [Cinara cedri]
MSFSADQSSTAQKAIKIEAVTPALELGEGPHWDISTQNLYFVDLHKSKINRYHPETGDYFSATIGGNYNGPVSFVIPVQGQANTFTVGLRESFGVVKWDGLTPVTSPPEYLKLVDDTPGVRLNDAKADLTGRLWLGTMGGEIKENPGNYYKHQGSLFSVERDGIVVKRLTSVSISNGLAWSLDNKELYYIDTYKFAVEAYDFDIGSGELSNGRVIFDLPANKINGDPDGMTIDTDGNLWVACFNSDLILKIDPKTGKLLLTVHLPAYQITSVAFGGFDLDELYVTTAARFLTEEQKSKKKLSGAVFKLTGTGSIGYAGVPVNLHLCPKNELDII